MTDPWFSVRGLGRSKDNEERVVIVAEQFGVFGRDVFRTVSEGALDYFFDFPRPDLLDFDFFAVLPDFLDGFAKMRSQESENFLVEPVWTV